VKRILIAVLGSFLLAIIVGVVLGMMRSSLQIGIVLMRAIISAITVGSLLLVAQTIWSKLFPVSQETSDTETLEVESNSIEEEGIETGSKVDVVFDDNPLGNRSYRTFADSEITIIEDPAQDGTRETGSDVFKHADPHELAQAVRTTLSRDK
jgi:hypothetical protein